MNLQQNEIDTAKLEGRLDRNHALRLRNEDRFLGRLEKLEAKAAPMIGELCREGRPIFYATLDYRKGRTFESGSWTEVAAFLIRNGYVR